MHQHLLRIAQGEVGNITYPAEIQREYFVCWINEAIELYPQYKEVIKVNNNKNEDHPEYYLSYNIFNKYFNEDYNSYEIDRTFSPNMAMAAFLGYPPLWAYKHIYEIDPDTGHNLKENEKKRIDLVQLLLGGWEVYYKDKTGVKINHLWLDAPRSNENDFFVHFNLSNNNQSIKTKGVGCFLKEKLSLELNNNDMYIKCIIELNSLDELKLEKDEEDIVLNAGAISTGFISTTIAHMVFRKRNNKSKVEFLSKPCDYIKTRDYITPIEKKIVYYLSRHKAEHIRLFDKSALGNLKHRNDHHRIRKGRKGYGLLKKLFKYPINKDYDWYSFSRIDHEPDHIRVFRWQFIFDNDKDKLTVDRYRINCEDTSHYKGEVLYQSSHLHIKMTSTIDPTKHKSVIAIIDNHGKNKILSISSTIYPENKVNESENIAVREIFYYLSKTVLTTDNYNSLYNGYLTFKNFAMLDINNIDKIYLSRRELATLSYPDTDNYLFHHKRLKEASHYEGDYYLFIGVSFKEQHYILALHCTIDSLANMILTVNKKVTYEGYIEEYLGHLTAHLESHTQHKITNMMFDKPIKRKKPFHMFSGVGLNSYELDPRVYHHAFLMLDKRYFENIVVSNTTKFVKDSKIIQILLDKFNYKFKSFKSLKKYFS